MMMEANGLVKRWRRIGRNAGLALGVFLFICEQPAWAEETATAPAARASTRAAKQPRVYETPQAFLTQVTTDVVAAMSVEEMMELWDYDPNSAKDKVTARLESASAIAESKLEKAVREKWGKEGETIFAHAIGDNMPADAPKAMWTIKDDHASASFQLDGLSPMLLAKRNGHWRLDLATQRGNMGDKIDKFQRDACVMWERLAKELAKKDAFADVEEFARRAKGELEKLTADHFSQISPADQSGPGAFGGGD